MLLGSVEAFPSMVGRCQASRCSQLRHPSRSSTSFGAEHLAYAVSKDTTPPEHLAETCHVLPTTVGCCSSNLTGLLIYWPSGSTSWPDLWHYH